MWTYILLNGAVIAACIALLVLRPVRFVCRPIVITMASLLVLTAVFDSLIIWAEIVGYNYENILGIYVGKAPLEDFAYAIVAVLLVPYVWERLGSR